MTDIVMEWERYVVQSICVAYIYWFENMLNNFYLLSNNNFFVAIQWMTLKFGIRFKISLKFVFFFLQHFEIIIFTTVLKEYSVIFTTGFSWQEPEDVNQNSLFTKISVDSNFMFSSYAWLCVFHCSHRLLCWIKSCVWDFLLVLSFQIEVISA